MILELAIGAGAVAAGLALARAWKRRAARRAEQKKPREASPKPAPARTSDDGLAVGDVVLWADTELWLAGEVRLDEEGLALVLFVTPGSRRAEYLAALDADGSRLALLSPTTEVPDGTVPSELPIGGLRLVLRRRGRAKVTTRGEHVPPARPFARYAVLDGAGGRTLVVVDFEGGARLALLGDAVARETVDILPGGGGGSAA
jgi:hypothetical protein